METISVITWHYSDKSGGGVVRAFAAEEDALDMLALLKAHSTDREFEIVSVLMQTSVY